MEQTSKNKNGIKILTSDCAVLYFGKSNMNMYRFRLVSNSGLHLACDRYMYIGNSWNQRWYWFL